MVISVLIKYGYIGQQKKRTHTIAKKWAVGMPDNSTHPGCQMMAGTFCSCFLTKVPVFLKKKTPLSRRTREKMCQAKFIRFKIYIAIHFSFILFSLVFSILMLLFCVVNFLSFLVSLYHILHVLYTRSVSVFSSLSRVNNEFRCYEVNICVERE